MSKERSEDWVDIPYGTTPTTWGHIAEGTVKKHLGLNAFQVNCMGVIETYMGARWDENAHQWWHGNCGVKPDNTPFFPDRTSFVVVWKEYDPKSFWPQRPINKHKRRRR